MTQHNELGKKGKQLAVDFLLKANIHWQIGEFTL